MALLRQIPKKRKQRIRFAYAVLFLCAAGIVILRRAISTTRTDASNAIFLNEPSKNYIKSNFAPCDFWTSKRSSSLSTRIQDDCLEAMAVEYPLHTTDTSTLQWCLPPSHHPNVFLKQPQLIHQQANASIVGLIFIKNTKAASSTGAGITLRIAEQVGQRVLQTSTSPVSSSQQQQLPQQQRLAATSCVRNWTHAFANARGHAKRKRHGRSSSLLWTILRHPASRDVSAFYFFEHMRQGVADTDDNLLQYLQAQKSGQFRYLHSHYIADDNLQPAFQSWLSSHQKQHQLSTVLHQLLLDYDFIALAERMDESLAVMTLLWKLQPSDVIVLNAKTKGGYDDGKFHKQCFKIPSRPTLSTAVQSFLYNKDASSSSSMTLSHQHWNLDYPLYYAANRSLDRTIQRLGSQRVRDRVQEIQNLQRLAHETCQSVAVFPCSNNGTLQKRAAQQSCYIDDSGCGHACVDQVLSSSLL